MTSADLVITGARVHGAGPGVTSLAVRDRSIVALGADTEEMIGTRTRHLHRPGALVMPGFQDAHVHPSQAGRNRLGIDLTGLASRAEYVAQVAAYAQARRDEPWLVGGGWAMEHFPGGTPECSDLDAVDDELGGRPVFLFNRDVHGAWVNSAALRIAGIDRDTPDPPDGRIERDPRTGEPTGTLHEGAAYTFSDRFVPPPTPVQWRNAICEAQRYLHSLGITAWQDAWVEPDVLAAYEALAGDGRLTARVNAALWWDRHRGMDQIADFVEQRHSVTAPGLVARTVKIMVDGVLENRTGALLEPYCEDGCGSGLSYVVREDLLVAVTELDRLGFQVHLHAIGDRAVRDALDAVAAARAANGAGDNRHHIAHVQVIHPSDVPRFAELGVVANCQAYWAQHEPQMDELTAPALGDERAGWQYPFADLLRTGARLAMGSDWPVTTPDPLQQLEVAVRRVDPEHRDNAPFLPAQRLSLQDAIEAFTAGSAHVNHDDGPGGGGVIEVGRRADLAVLDRDVFAHRADQIADARVTHTIASGAVVFEAVG